VILLDTGILFDFFIDGSLAGYTEGILSVGKGCVSSITVYELFRGVRNKKHIEQRKKLLAYIHSLELSSAIAVRAGKIYTDLRKSGVTIANEDILIAATAKHHNMEIFTQNKKHFEKIPGTRLHEPR
jgi:predicted nucleic acid-binding protein